MNKLVINGREVTGWRKAAALAGWGSMFFLALVVVLAIVAGSATVALAALTSPFWIAAKMLGAA